MSPPLVSFSVMASSASYPGIRQAGRFAVNILSGEQVGISDQFARKGTDKWHGVNGRRRLWVTRSSPAACTGSIARFTPNTQPEIT
jgi:flavin reductase (DIM6/NTAB) family NADH-FMN oxidoreductase RutF